MIEEVAQAEKDKLDLTALHICVRVIDRAAIVIKNAAHYKGLSEPS
jgi:hypothetical protein